MNLYYIRFKRKDMDYFRIWLPGTDPFERSIIITNIPEFYALCGYLNIKLIEVPQEV